MICKKMFSGMLVLMFLTLFPIFQASAAVQLNVMPTGSNVFVLQGNGLEEIAVLDFEFSYDPAVMGNPRGSRGGLIPSDAIFNFNPSQPGHIRLFIRIGGTSVNGSGVLATISFNGFDTAPGTIQSVTANLVTVKATPVFAAVQILNQPPPAPVENGPTTGTTNPVVSPAVPSGASPAVTQAAPATVPALAAKTVVAASVGTTGERTEPEKLLPGKKDGPPANPDDLEQQPYRQGSGPSENALVRVEQSSTKPALPLKKTVYQSVLDRMKLYAGVRTPAALTALFKPVAGQMVAQDPAVAVSDGETAVTLRVELPLTLKTTPMFTFRNASMRSLEQADDGSWVILLMPRKNTLEARISVSFDGSVIEYPLVISPPLDAKLFQQYESPEVAFTTFLKQAGPTRDTRFDMNGDGSYDYLDDYMFTAHYLVARQKSVRKTSTP